MKDDNANRPTPKSVAFESEKPLSRLEIHAMLKADMMAHGRTVTDSEVAALLDSLYEVAETLVQEYLALDRSRSEHNIERPDL